LARSFLAGENERRFARLSALENERALKTPEVKAPERVKSTGVLFSTEPLLPRYREAMLTSQAMTLNAMFADLSRRSAINLSDGSYFNAGERYFKMAMRAQNQCRMALETLSTIKNPPVVYAKQANIAHGPQQVNNDARPSRAQENQNEPNKLLEQSNEIPMDTGTPDTAGGSDSTMETVAELDRPANR
jgi:hypothetical protein